MSYPILTTQELVDLFIANIESRINQDTPPVDVAFNKVIATIQAMGITGLYKYAADRAKANLALTANEEDLETIGREYGVIRKPAESAVFEITLPGTNGTTIQATVNFIGISNGARYFPDASAVVTGGIATLTVTAEIAGVAGNLNVGETMSISYQIAGAETLATITVIDNIGANQENLEIYRDRVLFAIRSSTGGSDAADHKIWSEEVAGVKKASPYTGKPFGDVNPSYPGDRTVYIEATTAIDPDGIPPQSLLDEVREALNIDPVTGLSRPALGLTDSTLYVEPIERLPFYVTVTNIQIQSDLLAQVQIDIETAVTSYFLTLAPFIIGLDFQEDRKDIITPMTVSEQVQNVLTAAGGSCEDVTVGETAITTFSTFTLDPGITAKLGGITFV